MGNHILNREQLVESFAAVRSFLQAGRLDPVRNHFEVELKVAFAFQHFSGLYDIECRDMLDNESYILYSDVFKANGYIRPVWSSYHLFSYNDTDKSLTLDLEGKIYMFKHLL